MDIVFNVNETRVKVQGPANLLDLTSFVVGSDSVAINLPEGPIDPVVTPEPTVIEQPPSDGLYHVVLTERPDSVQQWNKIPAIKSVRTWTGMGLREAKDAVEGTLPVVVWSTANKEAATALADELEQSRGSGVVRAAVMHSIPRGATIAEGSTKQPEPTVEPKKQYFLKIRDTGPVDDTVLLEEFPTEQALLGAFQLFVLLRAREAISTKLYRVSAEDRVEENPARYGFWSVTAFSRDEHYNETTLRREGM